MIKRKSKGERRGDIHIADGVIRKAGRKVGTVMHELKFGYHPIVRLRLLGKVVAEYELDTPRLLDKVFAECAADWVK